MDNPFGITREEILELAAQKLADDAAGEEYIGERVSRLIDERIKTAIGEKMLNKVDTFLAAEMEKILRETITPVNIWGERDGEPTTLRDALAERARVFWDVKVDKDGQATASYYGTPRHQQLLKQLLNEEFTNAVRTNATEIVAAFRDAVKADSARIVNEHIDKLISVKR